MFFCYFLSHFRSPKQWKDLNPQTWEKKASDAPLCDCRLPSPSLLLNMIFFYSNNNFSILCIFLYHFNYQQRCRGLNPQPWVDEMLIWPLCNCRLPSPTLAPSILVQNIGFVIFYPLLGVQSSGRTWISRLLRKRRVVHHCVTVNCPLHLLFWMWSCFIQTTYLLSYLSKIVHIFIPF